MKYLYKRVLFFFTIISIASVSCNKTKFLDVNDNPNSVTENNITPELIFPQAAHAVGVQLSGANFTFLNQWLGYWSVTGDFAIPQDQTTYNIDNTFTNNIWESYYDNLFDLHQVQVKAIAEGDTVLAGASMILSAKLWQELVDMFGDIPYSQTFQNSQFQSPKYDKGQDIYNDLQKKLDTAISYMGQTERSTFQTVDIVNHGNKTLWIKFANTLKLRLLIRQSEISGFNPVTETAKITANGGVLHQGENINVNPGYSNTTNKQNPFYANYGLTPTGVTANTFNTANDYFISLLKSTNDPRLERFFKPNSSGTFTGSVYGLAQGNPPGAQTSNIGPGLAGSAEQDQWIMPAFESMFLEAEAIARGWLPGDAKTAYEAAVTESFVWLGVPDAVNEAANYLSNTTIANWSNAGSDPESQAKFIAYQKYIALAGVDPVEAWSDLRRLNMLPDNGYITVNPGKLSSTLPKRLPYPETEYTTNAGNVNSEGTINIFTSKIFWEP
jgi:hypothetical protein